MTRCPLSGGLVTITFLRSAAARSPTRVAATPAIAGIVGAVCAFALAAVWPISGWVLPFLRTAMDDDG